MAALDVTVKIYKNGVLVNGYGGNDGESAIPESSALLGKAVIGKMRLGNG